jgi:hypothetical protein
MTITTPTLIRWSGLAAIAAGLIFAGIQPIHPPDVLASVTTGTWAIITALKLAMCFLVLIGITGIYLRQAEKAGWLGLVSFALFGIGWALQSGFVFAEVFILPPLAATTPQYIDSFLGVVNGTPGEMEIGAIAPAFAVVGIFYLLGGLLFGISTAIAGVLPRWPAILLAVTALLTPAAVLLPHAVQRYAAVPMGIALIALGYSLWTERRETSAASATSMDSARLRAA